MSKSNISIKFVTPVLMSFFVMSLCDLVGIGVDRIKIDFTLSNTLAQNVTSAMIVLVAAISYLLIVSLFSAKSKA